MKIKDILAVFKKLAPEENQSSWDHSGVQIRGTLEETGKVAVALEPTPECMDRCLEWGADTVITHHPLYFKPMSVDSDSPYLEVLRKFMTRGAWLYASHTSLDTRWDGPAFWLGEDLSLTDRRLLEVDSSRAPVEAFFYVEDPISREDADLWADSDGVHCVAQSTTGEVRVVCDEPRWSDLAQKIEFSLGTRPVFYLRSLTGPKRDIGFGQVGKLPAPMSFSEFMDRVTPLIGRDALLVSGPQPDTVTTVAYCGGSGSSLMDAAAKAGADVFITGDMKYHAAVEAPVCVVDAGHFSLEEEMMRRFAVELGERLSGVEVRFFAGVDPFRIYCSK